jgi:peptide/nickel transport system permease protein
MSELKNAFDASETVVDATPATPSIVAMRGSRSPWFNRRLVAGLSILGVLVFGAFLGRVLWDTDLAFPTASPPNLPPVGVTNQRGQPGTWEHPLGTETSGRDMLALIILSVPNTIAVGFLAASVGTGIGIALGFTAGFLGGWVDDLIRLISDVAITIPALLILIVIQASVGQVDLVGMAFMISLFAWPGPTRRFRAQVLTMRESGYVRTAQISGVGPFGIMFGEMLPNLLPYIAAGFITAASGSIISAISLEVLGLGPTRIPTLGTTIANALNAAAIFRGMWWWWGISTLILVVIFASLLLINLGLDEIANPRLRKARRQK